MEAKLTIFLLCAYVSIALAWNKHMEVPGMYQGDIQLSPEQQHLLYNGANPFGSIVGRRWPGGKIAYGIESSIGSRGRSAIAAAIADYHKYTCLRFHQRSNERNYISFYQGNGCNSPVGMRGRNRISLGSGCQDKGTTLHEIGHSIGLQHEQCRPDRDSYVTVHYNNINGRWGYAFNKQSNVNSLGTPYDLESMMHYSSTAFAKRGKKTITTNDKSKQHFIDNYNRISGFSAMDIKQINLMYKSECGGTGTGTGTTIGPTTDDCDNKENRCEYWARNGYCTDTKEADYMKKNCCKACKNSVCPNNHTRCDEWAKRGECLKNPGYMNKNCKKACKRC